MPNGKRYSIKPLKAALVLSGFTLAKLAMLSDLSDSTVCRVFQKKKVSPRAVNAVASALRVPLTEVWR